MIGALILAFAVYQSHRAGEATRASLARVHTAAGSQLMEEGDLLKALLPLTKALELDHGNPARESIHRIRIASTLAQCPKPVAFFAHDQGAVLDASFSPDDQRVLTIGEDNRARVWDLRSGQCLFTMAHTHPLVLGRFSPGGDRILTGTLDSRSHLWNAADGHPVALGLPSFFRSLWRGCLDYYFAYTVPESDSIDLPRGIVVMKRGGHSRAHRAAIRNQNEVLVPALSGRGDDVVIALRVLDADQGDREVFAQEFIDTPIKDPDTWAFDNEPRNYLGRVGTPTIGVITSPDMKTNEVIFDDFRVRVIDDSAGEIVEDRILDDFNRHAAQNGSLYGWNPERAWLVATNGQLRVGAGGASQNYAELVMAPTPLFAFVWDLSKISSPTLSLPPSPSFVSAAISPDQQVRATLERDFFLVAITLE